ncbi:hypothetical protein BJY04DRAFT_196871 [Aspergillus karnatakaensis]|uniref:cytochrome b5 reductase family protein n=1 Tax=Aspergillus karnatakaensis TaxID=1810916 RepID=UPI003CCDC68B
MTTLLNRRVVTNTLAVLSVGAAGITLSRYFGNNAFAESPSEPKKVFGKGPAFKSLKLHSAEQVNHNTKRLRFELPGGEDSISGLGLTSALLTFSKPEGSWTPVVRPYTPVSKLDERGFIDLLVKKYPNGKASTHLHALNPGDSLFILASLPGFAWTPNKYPHIYLIAGGAGITPIYQLTQGILDNPADQTKVTVVFGVNTEEDLLLRKEFEEYKAKYPGRIDVTYTVSRPGKGFVAEELEGVREGYVTREVLEGVLKPGKEETKVFVCGPPAMETALVGSRSEMGILGQLGFGKESIHRF